MSCSNDSFSLNVKYVDDDTMPWKFKQVGDPEYIKNESFQFGLQYVGKLKFGDANKGKLFKK